jgi:hypothetical protein
LLPVPLLPVPLLLLTLLLLLPPLLPPPLLLLLLPLLPLLLQCLGPRRPRPASAVCVGRAWSLEVMYSMHLISTSLRHFYGRKFPLMCALDLVMCPSLR